ncbi:MAG: VOC family protein [Nakamurella sp.]
MLREVVIDVPSKDLPATREFWAAALLAEAHVVADYSEFIGLDHPASLSHVGLQDIGSDSARLHLDIETDDVEAEVARLTELGAVEQRRHRGWVVLVDPAGLMFCVVPPESPDFGERARQVN